MKIKAIVSMEIDFLKTENRKKNQYKLSYSRNIEQIMRLDQMHSVPFVLKIEEYNNREIDVPYPD